MPADKIMFDSDYFDVIYDDEPEVETSGVSDEGQRITPEDAYVESIVTEKST